MLAIGLVAVGFGATWALNYVVYGAPGFLPIQHGIGSSR